jgi:ABC-type nitrate/sulfonate/bicarbonate transport system substrate-binding protein
MRALALIVALLMLAAVPVRAAANDVVRLPLNPSVLGYLPMLIAIDRGYFAEQHIDLQLKPSPGAAMLQLPALARGDVDIAPMVLAPAFINQLNEGFSVKLIASIQSSHAGWNDNSWILVRQDVWDSGAIRKPADLRGKTVDGASPGGPPNILMKALIASAGLTAADMTYTEKLHGPVDFTAAFHNHAVEVLASFEPGASVMQLQHMAHKWVSVHDVIPWLQETFLAASGPFLKDHSDVVTRFLIAYLKGARDLSRSNGHWTPALLAILSKYAEIPVPQLAQVPGPAYVDPLGAINSISIDRQQEFYLSEHLIAKPIAFADMVDTRPLFAATRALAFATQRK